MAHAITINDYAAPAARGFVARLRQAVADYRTYRETRRELEGLSDRLLADLGIDRGSISDVARRAIRG